MPLSRVSLATEVVGRARGFLVAAGLSVALNDTNAVVMLAGRKALARVGLSPADPGVLADDDVAAVPAAKVERYFDAATLETLRIILLNLASPDQSVDNDEQKLSQIADALRKAIAILEDEIKETYGASSPQSIAVGRITKGSPLPNDARDAINTHTFPYWPYPEGA